MVKKILKFIYMLLIVFALVNVIIPSQSYIACANSVSSNTQLSGGLHPVIATVAKIFIASAQVIASGFFILRFTLDGIAYFTVTAAQDKAASKKRIEWTIFYATITYVAMFIFTKALGL